MKHGDNRMVRLFSVKEKKLLFCAFIVSSGFLIIHHQLSLK